MTNQNVIAVDLDGVLWENVWPNIGMIDWCLFNTLLETQSKGYRLIANTCRTGDKLKEAIDQCLIRGLRFDAVNENLPERIEEFGGDCRKISADYYIDDKSVGYNRDRVIEWLNGLPDLRKEQIEKNDNK